MGALGSDSCLISARRTNLHLKDLLPVKEDLTQLLFDFIPVGVGSKGILPTDAKQLSDVLEMGMDWSVRQGYAWVEDKEHCEENGRMLTADPAKVSLVRRALLGHVCQTPLFSESAKARSAAAGNAGSRQPLHRGAGGGEDLRQVCGCQNGH